MRPSAALILLLVAGCETAPTVEYRYDYDPLLAGLSRIEGTATNRDDAPRTLVLTIGCEGDPSKTVRLESVAPGGTAAFDEFALCDSPGASVLSVEYAD